MGERSLRQETLPGAIRGGENLLPPAVVIDPKHQDLRRIGAKLLQEALTTLGWDSVLAVDYRRRSARSLPAFVCRGLGSTLKEEILDRLVYQIFSYKDPG